MTAEPERYEIRFQPTARRAVAERLPEAVAAAVLEFCEVALAVGPHRVGKPLSGPSPVAMARAAAPTGSCTGSMRATAPFTSSISIIALTSFTGPEADRS